MKVDTHPAFARRMRLSTAGITAAVVVTCAALLAIAVAVGPSSDGEPESSVSFEAPEASNNAVSVAPALFASGKLQPVGGTIPDAVTGH